MYRRSFHLAVPALLAAGTAGAQATALFNGRDFDGWDRVGDANWRVEEGIAIADRGTGFLVSRASHRDFQLLVEVWLDTTANSGIFIRCTDPATITSVNAYEVNLWDERPEQRYGTGAIVDVSAVDPMPRAGNRWNTLDITARGDAFTVLLNGQKTVDGARNARHATGRIALQHAPGVPGPGGAVNDRGAVRFRKVELRTL